MRKARSKSRRLIFLDLRNIQVISSATNVCLVKIDKSKKKVTPPLGSKTNEENPFNKNKLFKFNPEKVVLRKNSSLMPDISTTNKGGKNLDKIKEKAPYRHSSDKSLPRYIQNGGGESAIGSLEIESSVGESEGHSGYV